MSSQIRGRLAYLKKRGIDDRRGVSASDSNGLLCENKEASLDDLAMLVKRLVRQLRKHNDGDDVANKAMDYLKRNGLNKPFHL